VSAPEPQRWAPVVLVMGKGGVGKTTVAAGLAELAAQRWGRSVLVEFGDGAAGRRALGNHGGPRSVEHLVIRPDEAIARGAAPLFGSAMVAKLVLGNFAMRPLLKAAPAVRELAMLESVRQIAAERPGVRVVVDMPATGHGVAWLRIPRQGRDFLGAGPIFELCDRLARELLGAAQSSIVVVTLPEPLVLEETLELCAAIELEARVDCVVVNRFPDAPPPQATEELEALVGRGGPIGEAARWVAATLASRERARAEARAEVDALSRRARSVVVLPLGLDAPTSSETAHRLGLLGVQ
jgi:arsenite/tail-anchored protein-transporting ATPase